jgi:ligand-binding sensor domain-containing protein
MSRLLSKLTFPAKLRWTVLAGVILAAAFGAFWIVRAMQALEEAKSDPSRAGVRFQFRPISDSKPDSVDFLSTSPDFRDAQLFHESMYLAGAGGIWVYDLAGEPRATYLVGRDLPASPPTAMTVGTLAGDADARLWIGTAAGTILVFDGGRFSQIQLQENGYGAITSLLMLPTGVLLAGYSEAGLFAYDGTAIRPFHPNLRNVSITALAGDDGDLWIGTRDRGVIHWQGGGAEEFQDPNGLPDNRVLSIAASQDRVFVGTPIGVAEFQSGRRNRTIAEGVFARSLLAIGDRLLIGTIDEGILEVKLDNARGFRLPSPSDFSPAEVRRLVAVQGIPFALAPDGLFEQNVRTGLWTRRIEAANASWTDRNVSALALDGAGKLWVGYFDRGIDIADTDLRKSAHVEDEQVFCINRIVWDAQKQVQIVATANGVVFFSPDGKILRRLGKADGLISEHVTDIAVSSDGFVAATSSGVTLMKAGGPESIYAFQGLVNNHVYSLGMSGRRLLAGTLGGLSQIEDGFVRSSYTTANSPLKHNWISGMTRLRETWFIGTYGGGILQLDAEGGWEESPGIAKNTVINTNAMITIAGRVLAGTLDRGLLTYDPAERRWKTWTEGLPSLNVTALAASSSAVFVGTDNGIVRLPIEKILQ